MQQNPKDNELGPNEVLHPVTGKPISREELEREQAKTAEQPEHEGGFMGFVSAFLSMLFKDDEGTARATEARTEAFKHAADAIAETVERERAAHGLAPELSDDEQKRLDSIVSQSAALPFSAAARDELADRLAAALDEMRDTPGALEALQEPDYAERSGVVAKQQQGNSRSAGREISRR